MKKFIQLLGTSLILVFVLQGTVFASELKSNSAINLLNEEKGEHRHCKPSGHYSHSAYEILKNKYGVTEKEFEEAKSKGKTYFDIAKSKSVREIDLRAAIIDPKLKALDAMASTGQLTKEKCEEIKSKVKDKMSKWDGKIEDYKKDKDCHRDANEENTKEQAS